MRKCCYIIVNLKSKHLKEKVFLAIPYFIHSSLAYERKVIIFIRVESIWIPKLHIVFNRAYKFLLVSIQPNKGFLL